MTQSVRTTHADWPEAEQQQADRDHGETKGEQPG
jgi:hypothetical protein